MNCNRLRPILIAAVGAASYFSSAAVAEPPPAFAAHPVADADLAGMRAGFIRPATLRASADVQARDSFRQTASVGSVIFDNWFNDVGSILIYNNLLATAQ